MMRIGILVVVVWLVVLLLVVVVDLQGMIYKEVKGIGLFGSWRGFIGFVMCGVDGKVIFLFGEIQFFIVCLLLQVCDIELQGGEIVCDVFVGDIVCWKVEFVIFGVVNGQVIYFVVKLFEFGLVILMVVIMLWCIYYIQLKLYLM